MQINDKFFYINIRDYLALGNDDKAGEPMLARVLSGLLNVHHYIHAARTLFERNQQLPLLGRQ